MATITEWLASLGLSEYAKRFTESDIDVSVLRHLTDQDLKELGVSLGHRRKMLAATAELAGAAALPPTHLSPEPKRRDNAERRQLTVMFCDLVGSTMLSTRLDPEDLRAVIGTYHKCVVETVGRFDGFVAKYMGDGCWSISATHAHTRRTARGRHAPGLPLLRRCQSSRRPPISPCRCVSGSPRAGGSRRPYWRGCGPGAGGRR